MSNTIVAKLTSGRLLAKNTFWNLFGQVLPLVVGVIVIPRLIHGLGTARFGILTLGWAIVGYTSLFDLGLSRALTKLVAEKIGGGEGEGLPSLIWTALGIMLFTGIMGALIMAAITPWLVGSALHIPVDLRRETLVAFYEIAACVPVVIVMAGLRGILEAQQLFAVVNAIRIPIGVLTFLGPWLVVLFVSTKLTVVILSLAVVRFIALIGQMACVLFFMPALRHERSWQGSAVRPLLSFGGWMTVSNIVGPLMVYLDRFLIGMLISMSAVAFYATPFEVATKFLLIPFAIAGVAFPAFSSSIAQNPNNAVWFYEKSTWCIFTILFVIVFATVNFAHDLLSFWIGSDFANHSTIVLQLLSIGVYFHGLGHIPFALIQGSGRPDLTAKLHVLEFPFYLGLALWLIPRFGVKGAALAWAIRVSIDAAALFGVAEHLVPACSRFNRRVAIASVLAVVMFGVGTLTTTLLMKTLTILIGLPLCSTFAWLFLLTPRERESLRNVSKLAAILS